MIQPISCTYSELYNEYSRTKYLQFAIQSTIMTPKTSLIILPIPRYRLFAHFGHFVCFSSNHQRLEIPAKQQICKVKQQGIYRYRAILRGQVDTSEGINNGTKHFIKLHSNFLVSIFLGYYHIYAGELN